MANDEYYTPKWIFEILNVEFDLDVAAPEQATNVPAKKKFTKLDDGLAQDWHGLVWMNPPYSAPKLWVQRFIAHNNGIALLPAAKSKWLDDLWESDCRAVLMPTNMKFEVVDGANKTIQFQTILWGAGSMGKLLLNKFQKRSR